MARSTKMARMAGNVEPPHPGPPLLPTMSDQIHSIPEKANSYRQSKGVLVMNAHRIAVATLLAVTMAACGVTGSNGPQAPGERLVAAMELIRDGKPRELEAFVVNDDQPGVGMFFGVYSSGWAAEDGLNRVDIVSEEIDGDSATVAARFHFVNGSTEEVTYQLKKEDNVWKIMLP
jgi:hypothetical protein